MKKMTTDYKLDFDVTEKEIRVWMDAEIIRMGEWFKDFTITWHRTGDYRCGRLYLWSEAKYDYGKPNHPYGKGLMICEIYDGDGLYITKIQTEGRKLYYKLRKDYPVKRELGRC